MFCYLTRTFAVSRWQQSGNALHDSRLLRRLGGTVPLVLLVPWDVCGVGKLTMALKVAAGQDERDGGWLRLVFRLSACSNTPLDTTAIDFQGLLDEQGTGRAPSYAAEEMLGRVHERVQSPAWSRAWLAVLDDLPRSSRRRPTTAGEGSNG
jgi:hypothetical protein